MKEMFGDSSWIIGIISALLLYLHYWYRRPRNSPPGPRGIPVLGYLPMISTRPQEKAYELSKKYGPIISIRIGGEDVIFLNDYDSISKAFVKQGPQFSGRFPIPALKEWKQGNGIAFVDYGDLWKSQRKFGLMTLRGFGVGKKGMENICLEELSYLSEELRKTEEKPIDMGMLLHNVVSNNICHVVFGRRFDYNDQDFRKLLKVVVDIFLDPFLGFTNKVTILAPNLANVPPFSWGVKRVSNAMRGVFASMAESIKEHEKTFDENNLRDFIDAFIAEKRKQNDPHFTDNQLLNFIHELFVAGTGTASNTLSWILLCFLHFPETQTKIRNEASKVVGSSGRISMSHKIDMPYTCAFMSEVLRWRTIAPLGLTHKMTEDTYFNGYFIPKDTRVQANIWAVHNDPNLWKDPHKFMPERFLDEQGNFVNSSHLIPFSIGPRHCLGEQLARMEIFIFLVGMLQKFEFHPDPNATELPDIVNAGTGPAFTPLAYKIVAKEI